MRVQMDDGDQYDFLVVRAIAWDKDTPFGLKIEDRGARYATPEARRLSPFSTNLESQYEIPKRLEDQTEDCLL